MKSHLLLGRTGNKSIAVDKLKSMFQGKKSAICGLQQWSSQNNEGTIIYTTVYEEVNRKKYKKYS